MTASDQATLDFGHLSITPGYRLAVVGSHGGIGAALCEAATRLGAQVAALDTESAISQNPALRASLPLTVDVRDHASLERAFATLADRWGGIDGLAYVTGVGVAPCPASDHTVEQWDRTLDINLRGAFVVSGYARPLLTAGIGSAVFVSSGLAATADPGFAAYSASKAGLVALMKVLAKEWAPGIRVNAIAPGIVDTPFLSGGAGHAAARRGSAEEWFGAERAKALIDAVPLKRLGEPDDIVAPLLFLLGSGARYITGQTLYVNGGRFMP